jgi:hypothetical protein
LKKVRVVMINLKLAVGREGSLVLLLLLLLLASWR